MTLIDISTLVLIALGTIHGCFRGLSGELAHVLSIIAAFVFGLWFHHPFALWMMDNTRLGARPAQALAFTTTILSALMVMFCLQFGFRRIMKVVIEENFDKIGGGIAGFIRSCLVVVIIFILFNMWPHEYLNRKFGDESMIGSFLRSQGVLIESGPANPEHTSAGK